eukprot:4760039-Amphidinium_carterae.1
MHCPDSSVLSPLLGARDRSGFLLFATPFPGSRVLWKHRLGPHTLCPDFPATQLATRALETKPQTSVEP